MKTRIIVVAVMLCILALSARAFLLLQERRIASDTIEPWSLTNEWHFLFEEDAANNVVAEEEGYAAFNDTDASENTANITTAGKVLKCFDYDGSTYLQTISDNATYFESYADGDKGMMYWITCDDWSTVSQAIVAVEQSDVDFTLATMGSPVQFRWSVSDNDGDTATVDYPVTNLSDDTWYHITVTWDESEGVIEMFVNAQSVGSATNANLVDGSFDDLGPAKDFGIGARRNEKNDWSDFWNGKIDDARGLNFIPTQTQIDGVYNNGNGTQDDSGP